jgi:hypothetical protein
MTMPAEWITRLAEDERQRDDVRLRLTEAAARKTNLVVTHGQRFIDELRSSVSRDIESFREEFPGDVAREIVFESAQPDGGFVVSKPGLPTVALSVSPRLLAALVSCQYRFTPTKGLPPREDRQEFLLSSNGGEDDPVQLKHQGTGQVFKDPNALSEYLLTPVFTGRAR